MKKLISLLLALVLICSLIPISAMAAFKVPTNKIPDISNLDPSKKYDGKPGTNGTPSLDTLEQEHKEKLNQLISSDNLKKIDDKDDDDDEVTLSHGDEGDEIIGYGYDTKYHWLQCACGCKFGMELHVDPKDTTDDTCICGYHFSDNADLVTLWVKGCPGIKYFNKNTTEYKLNAYTYKDVKEIKISTRTHDCGATVELPEDLTLKEGENKFEVKVTAENQKVTKIYTLIITKEAVK